MGIRWLVVGAGLVFVLPVLASEQVEYSEATGKVELANQATESVAELEGLMHLAPAFGLERMVVSTMGGLDKVSPATPATAVTAPSGMPASFTPPMATETFDMVNADAGEAIDEALGNLDNPTLTSRITALRTGSREGTTDIARINEESEDIAAELSQRINDEILRLSSVTARLGGADELIAAAETAQAAVELQRIQAVQAIEWALIALPLFSPPASDVRALSHSLASQEEAAADLERLSQGNPALADAWADVRDSEAYVGLTGQFEQSVEQRIALGLVDVPREWSDSRTMTPELIVETIAFVDELTGVIETSSELSELSRGVVDTALADVQSAVAKVTGEAETERNLVLWKLVGMAVLALIAALLLGRLVSKPLKRVAAAAEGVRDGDLSDRLPERGPSELRVAARAMNESIESLSLVESQAVALADGDLDDPVLEQPATGTIGRSIQSAVDRLAASISSSEKLQRRLAHEAAHDGLTGLPNRNAILASVAGALARVRRNGNAVAVLFLDVDEFKSINDTYGHQSGDTVLGTVAERLLDTIREGDAAGRLGGDEFLVLAEPVAGIAEAKALARRLHAELTRPIDLDGATIEPRISIGVAVTSDGSMTEDELVRDADLAVYRAKELGRARVEVYDDELRSQVSHRAGVEAALREAITEGQLMLDYQPSIDAHTEAVTSVEALVRWDRPGEGIVAPGAFIPVAERSDLIVEVDRWVLSSAMAQASRWQGDPAMAGIPVSVNISARHLASGALVESVEGALDRHGVDPSGLVIEVTETALLSEVETAASQLGRLRDMGIRIALDDFGTGFMSLATLRSLPVDAIKVDRSFVRRLDVPDERSLVNLIIGTGHVLGLSVTAEGVETRTQRQRLVEMGADELQGFLFSKPVHPDEIVDFLAGRSVAGSGAAVT